MKRRDFIMLAGGAAAWPLAAGAQQAVPVIGFLHSISPDSIVDRMRGFRQGLGEAGYVEGENVAIEYRWAENRLDRLPALAAELVARKAAVIVAIGGTSPALAAQAATTTIPIVFSVPEDPVKLGIVASLSRPGGNMTGVNLFVGEVLAKRLEVLRELVPRARRIAVFVNAANAARAASQVKEVEAAASAMGLQVEIFNTGTAGEINAAFARLAREAMDALFVAADPFFVARCVQLAVLAARHALPASYSVRDHVAAGGLMSYGTNIFDGYRQVGRYAGQVLKGAKPSELPVLQSSKFELVINGQTASMLGLTLSPSLLAVADEVIE